MLNTIWSIFGMYWLGMAVGYLMCRWVHRDKIKAGTPSTSSNSRRNAISKKDAAYARSMHRLEDEQDALDARDLGEAYNFHMDCGDR